MRLWVEHAHQSLGRSGDTVLAETGHRAVRTFQTEEQFWAILVSCPSAGAEAGPIAASLAALLEQGTAPGAAVETVLASLPLGGHVPISILQVLGEDQARLVECDAPPLFLTRRGQLVLLPVLEDVICGRLVRQCQFRLRDGDYAAIVSEEYIHTKGWDRRWGWRDIALSIRRLTATGGDAEQLLGALLGMVQRLAQGEPPQEVTVIALRVRPLRSATVWSGPPADPAQDESTVRKLLAAPGVRIICGDTTAEIAARVLGARLEREPRPADGWAEVPPTWRLPGVDLVTEGVVTLRKACERLTLTPHRGGGGRGEGESDGATRLARLLLAADVIGFLIGRAVNPAQTDGVIPWRQGAIEKLVVGLRARGKIVSVEHLD